jgi:hypothetical protein
MSIPSLAASAAAFASSLSSAKGITIWGRTTPLARGRRGRVRVSRLDIECLAIKKFLSHGYNDGRLAGIPWVHHLAASRF